MKKFTILLIVLFAFSLNAQITINSNDLVGIGKVIEEAYDWSPDASIKPGQAGGNKTWDFSNLSADETSTILTTNPAWTPYGMFFPNSNLAFYSNDDSVYIYMEINPSQFNMMGMFTTVLDSIELPIIYDPPIVIAEFPVQYMNQKDNQASFEFMAPISVTGIDSAKLKMDVISEIEVDAWGTITTPLGTFDALRIYTYEEAYDSIWFKAGGYWSFWTASKDVTDSYAWWTDDDAAGFQLVEMSYYAAQDSVADVTFLNATPTQSLEKKHLTSILNIYPNPADNYINFDYKNESIAAIKIFDNTGRLIMSKILQPNEINKFTIEKYQSGVYFYNLIGENGEIISKGKFCKR